MTHYCEATEARKARCTDSRALGTCDPLFSYGNDVLNDNLNATRHPSRGPGAGAAAQDPAGPLAGGGPGRGSRKALAAARRKGRAPEGAQCPPGTPADPGWGYKPRRGAGQPRLVGCIRRGAPIPAGRSKLGGCGPGRCRQRRRLAVGTQAQSNTAAACTWHCPFRH